MGRTLPFRAVARATARHVERLHLVERQQRARRRRYSAALHRRQADLPGVALDPSRVGGPFDPSANRGDELIVVSAGQVGAADGPAKKAVTGKDGLFAFKSKNDVARRVAGTMTHLKTQIADL